MLMKMIYSSSDREFLDPLQEKEMRMTRTLCCFSEDIFETHRLAESDPSYTYSHSTHSATLLFPVHSSSSALFMPE